MASWPPPARQRARACGPSGPAGAEPGRAPVRGRPHGRAAAARAGPRARRRAPAGPRWSLMRSSPRAARWAGTDPAGMRAGLALRRARCRRGRTTSGKRQVFGKGHPAGKPGLVPRRCGHAVQAWPGGDHVRIGLQIPDFSWPGGPAASARDLATVARTADDAGFDFIALMDHFFQIGVVGPPENEMLEAYTTLGYLAACTSRARLLTLVTGVVYRHPGVLAQDRHHARRAVRRPGLAGHRRGLERGGVARAWASRSRRSPSGSSGSRRRSRSACRCGAATSPRIQGRHYQLERPLNSPAGADQAAPADHDRRRRRAQDAAAGGPLRPGVQPVPRPRPGPQARRAARALRGRGPRLRRDRARPATSSSTPGEKGEQAGEIVDQLGALAEMGFGPRSARWPASGT